MHGFRSPTSQLNIYAPPVDITWLCRATDEAHSVAGPSLLERTASRSLRPVAHCWRLPANIKDSIIHQILLLVYSTWLRSCITWNRAIWFPISYIGGPLEGNQASISNGFRDIQWRMWRNVWHDLQTKFKVIHLVLIDFSYTTSYRLSIVTFAVGRTV